MPLSTTTTTALCVTHLSPDLAGVMLREQPLQPPGPGEVLVRAHAAALNFPDLLMTQGLYQYKPALPYVCGMEGAGTVQAVGDGVVHLKPGDAVYYNHLGTVASSLVLPAQHAHRVPPGLSLQEAAAMHVVGITAWVALMHHAQLQRGQWLLVHGARGGVGHACVQLGLHLGARVMATTREPAALHAFERQGVKVFSSLAPLKEAVMAHTQGHGVDVLADPVGGDPFDEGLRCMAFGGRVLVLGFAAGRIPTLAVNRALIKGLAVHGVRAGELGRQRPELVPLHRAAVEHLASAGVLRPHIGARFELPQAKEALQAMARGGVTGKIVVTMPS